MSIISRLGEDFLKIVLTEREYKVLVLQESPQQIKASMRAVMDAQITLTVKKSGNSGHVYLPCDWVGKTVVVSRID